MIRKTAVEAELASVSSSAILPRLLRTEQSRWLWYANGHHPARQLQTGHWPCERAHSKVRSKDGTPVTNSGLPYLPPYVPAEPRRWKAALPWLYLKGFTWRNGRGPQGSSGA